MAREGEHGVAYKRLKETMNARFDMKLKFELERRQYDLNLSQVTQELVTAKQCNMRSKHQFEIYQERYKRRYQELTIWIAQQKVKTCSDCQQLKTFDSDPPVMKCQNPFNDLTNHCSVSGIKETATVTPSNNIHKTPKSTARLLMSSPVRSLKVMSPMGSPIHSPARVSASFQVRSSAKFSARSLPAKFSARPSPTTSSARPTPAKLSARPSPAKLSARPSPTTSSARPTPARLSIKSFPMRSSTKLKKEHADSPTQLEKTSPLWILELDSDDQSQALLDPKHSYSLP